VNCNLDLTPTEAKEFEAKFKELENRLLELYLIQITIALHLRQLIVYLGIEIYVNDFQNSKSVQPTAET
jgi:hypothetical protein